MTDRTAFSPRFSGRKLLLLGASLVTLAVGLAPGEAAAQTMGGLLGKQASTPRPQAPVAGVTPQRSPTMQAALARQRATQSRVDSIRAYASALREAAARGAVTDGLAPDGLDPTVNIREAIAAVRAGDVDRANQLLVSARAANDPTGTATWEGAGLPTQSVVNGRTVVTIDQTQERALLSWNRFDIGANTTLNFNQKQNGAAQPGWVVVNRVTNATDPSLILGNMTADGTVVVLNRAGIIFGKNSQVNTHSLLASTLELGNAVAYTGVSNAVRGVSIAERNAAFLDAGLFAPGTGTLSLDTLADPEGPGVLVSAEVNGTFAGPGLVRFGNQVEGAVLVDSGAKLASGAGGFLVVAAPNIQVDGSLSAVEGQVSLQASRLVAFTESTGGEGSLDPYVRGYKFADLTYGNFYPSVADPGYGHITVNGTIQSQRGYLSLGTSRYGTVDVNGYLAATTSVSRNGKIELYSGSVTLGGSADPKQASAIVILPDESGETIPRGTAAEPSSFKSSQIVIARQVRAADQLFDVTAPTDFTMGANAVIYAPNADVKIGAFRATEAERDVIGLTGSIDIASGALIDVSGLKDVALDASRNVITITPVKRNELSDTPTYREVVLDGNFTLNGATLYIDPRVSGVREDGVAWVGSPLLQAAQLAGQIPAAASEFMTAGGTVELIARSSANLNVTAADAPLVRIARDATIDISGGWVRYNGGTIRTSRLLTNDGRIVDIAKASPNDVYVGVVENVVEVQPRFGIMRNYLNSFGQSVRTDPAYDEGRDAGSLTITGAATVFEGTLFGNAFAGARQIASGDRPSATSAIEGDVRRRQATPYQLPAAGRFAVDTMGDVIVYHGVRGSADGSGVELLLDDAMLSAAGLQALQIQSSGAVTFANAETRILQGADVVSMTGASNLTLADGGSLVVNAGRTIRFDGTVTAASGAISAETVLFGGNGPSLGITAQGSLFREGAFGDGLGDDLPLNRLYAVDPGDLNPFDILVSGTLSTAGAWVNDYAQSGIVRGGAFGDGGRISLTVAPNAFMAVGTSVASATQAVDLSGSIRVSGTLNVMAGGHVDGKGKFDLSGRGGDVSLVNATRYASSLLTFTNNSDVFANLPIGGNNQSVDFTPITGPGFPVTPALVPTPSATVDIASATILGYGFAGGGTFALTAPDISFGSDVRPGSAHVGLDFFQKTGFGTVSLTSYRSRIVDDLFTNARAGKSAFFETSQFTIGAGETLDLTQWVMPSILGVDQARALRELATGASLADQSYLAPIKPVSLWDQRGANLVLDGLTELDVLAGGRIVGAPEASITLGKLYNAGEITLAGGSIVQRNPLPVGLLLGIGVRDTALGGNGLADAFGGPVDAEGRFDENALNAAGVTTRIGSNARLVTNRELVALQGADRIVYFTGLVGPGDGVVLAAGSVTDLSGVALYNPRAPLLANGTRLRAGRVVAGGTLRLRSGPRLATFGGGASALAEDRLVRDDAARVDISGASGFYDLDAGLGSYRSYLEWSSAGVLSALGGGTLGSTPIRALGGAAAAQGGTLEWLRPTIGDGADTALVEAGDYLLADTIAGSGFDSVTAYGGLVLDGAFDLALRKSFIVTSREPEIAGTTVGTDAQVVIRATEGADAHVRAGYIRFASRTGTTALARTATDSEVRFTAGGQGIDVVGGIAFSEIGSLALATAGDLRFTGVNMFSAGTLPVSDGQLVASGDLLLDARRVYATTGTGNYQALLEGVTATNRTAPYDITVIDDHSITFGNSYLDPTLGAPLSAGTYLRVRAPRIVQNGYLAAPLGLIELGSNQQYGYGQSSFILATQSITFGAGSVTTVSGAGLTLPYGSTTDLIEYYYPTIGTPITRLPTGELRVAAGSIVQEEGAKFDGRGGGDVYGYEFVPGVGGSRDVLDRFNRDAYSSNHYDPATGRGYQYEDGRQIFALVPLDQAGAIAPYDPSYSADYGSAGPVDLYGAAAGRTVILEGGPGVAAGEYLLVPAKYAMAIPGALRVVENTGTAAPLPGQSTTLHDGSVIVAGRYGTGATGISESQRRSFTLQSKDVFLSYSSIRSTSGSQAIIDKSTKADVARPLMPLDAARVILSPLTELRLAGAFDTRAGEGGQGGRFDILGSRIAIAAAGAESETGTLVLTDAALARLNATSLLIGGSRTENSDGTTGIAPSATSITVRAGASLAAPELLLAVGGTGSQLTVEDGAVLAATGTVGTQRSGDYRLTTGGSLLRLANGGDRLVNRTGTGTSSIRIGAASLTGESLVLDSSGTFTVADAALLQASRVAISGQSLRFDASEAAAGEAGVIGAALEAKLAAAAQLTIRSPGAIRFSAGTHRFNNLVLDTASIASLAGSGADSAVTLVAGNVRLTNTLASADGCATAGFCGTAQSLTIDAGSISFGSNAMRAAGFSDTVVLGGRDGIYVEGKGSFSAGAAALTLRAPILAERAVAADPRQQAVRPDFAFLTTGDFVLSATGTNLAATPTGNLAPGARIGIGSSDARVASVRIEGSRVRATAGIVDIQSQGDVTLAGAAIETPGYLATFGDKDDPVTIGAGAGTVNLVSTRGSILTDAASRLVVDSGVGNAGALNLLASNGSVTLAAALNPDAKGPRTASLALDSGTGAFDFAGFVTTYGTRFGGDIAIRSGAGDLTLAAGQALKAKSVMLTADGGAIAIAGTIDTSGVDVTGMKADAARDARVNGGDIALWGQRGVTLASSARLDTHTSGYADTDSRPASAGDVTIGIGAADAALVVSAGAVIDTGARRTQAALAVGDTGARLVPEQITDAATGRLVTVYRYAEADTGGTVLFRAPVLGTNADRVNVSIGGTIVGADSVQLEGFLRYDLDALLASGQYSGITATTGGVALNFAANGATSGGRLNPFTEDFLLADGTKSMVRFVQGFDVSTVDGSSLAGIRLRPGVELVAKGDISTTSAWNLAAANFSNAQLQAAVAAGDLVLNQALSNSGNPYYTGQPVYSAVAGREGHLLENYATFLYRVGGSAAGEAPIVSFRAGGNLTINRSINDGFFVFRDKSDAGYSNYQLGGGTRSYSPALGLTCPNSNCGTSARPYTGSTLPANQTITISLSSTAQQGAQQGGAAYTAAPLAISGNGAAAIGTGRDAQGNVSGDPLGFAELFPLLADGSAMHSSDLRLVAGAGDALSVNPLTVDAALSADVKVTGEYSYVQRGVAGTRSYGGPWQFNIASGVSFNIGDTLNDPTTSLGVDRLVGNEQTQINFGSGTTGPGADARAAALAFFAGRSDFFLVGSSTRPTGLVAPLSAILAFLQSFEPTYQANLAAGNTGYRGSLGSATTTTTTRYVRTAVRTGDGDIAVAAARDIDVRGSDAPVYRRANGTLVTRPTLVDGDPNNSSRAGQFGAAAIYTAGVRVAQAPVTARIIGGGARVSISPDSPYLGFNPATPSANNAFLSNGLVLARGGGDVLLDAGRDVVAQLESADNGSPTQTWRRSDSGVNPQIGNDTEIGLDPRYFVSGVGALAGGDVTVHARRDVRDLTIALNSGVTTTLAETGMADPGKVMLSFGTGDLDVAAGRDILAGRYDIASGRADIVAGGDVASLVRPNETAQSYLHVRLSDAAVNVAAGGAARVGSVSALGVFGAFSWSNQFQYVSREAAAAGFFSPGAAFNLQANQTAAILGVTPGYASAYGWQPAFFDANLGPTIEPQYWVNVLPPSLAMTSTSAGISLNSSNRQMLYPSPIGQLRLFSQGGIERLSIAMSDVDPGLIGGAFSASTERVPYRFPVVAPNTLSGELRYQHSRTILHRDDDEPVRIYSNGDIVTAALFLPKQARVTAGGDIVDLFFQGQNLTPFDITRVRAGGSIYGSYSFFGGLPTVTSNNFILGGPGKLIVEAGRDLGPFMTSAVQALARRTDSGPLLIEYYSSGGGIRTVGNDYNPWLGREGADLEVRFGMGAGADYAALRETYLNPDNFAMLDGDLFEQVTDNFGNSRPDRARPVYAPQLAQWLRRNDPDAFAAIFGGDFPDTEAGNAALAQAAYGRAGELYAAFAAVDPLRQQDFLVNGLLFGEIAAVGTVDGPSFEQYIRGYRAIQTLFPARLGYTDNLAPYTIDPSTITPDHPLGVPVRNRVDGEPQAAQRVRTGSADLRLSTLQTGRGGDLTVLAPGGDLIVGSVVRTAEQPSRRGSSFDFQRTDREPPVQAGRLTAANAGIVSIPLGYEGLLTLAGGQIRGLTDGNLTLNQSRVFTQQGGDITLWSSNGDLAAGQGPKSAANFPPVTVRFDENGRGEVNSAGSVSGAGIGSFQRYPDDPASDVILIAPVGTVDAGDAGVRASGNIVVAAARVANADNFTAAGDITGVPSAALAPVAVTATPGEVTAQLDAVKRAQQAPAERRAIITVQVLGPASDGVCSGTGQTDDPDCR